MKDPIPCPRCAVPLRSSRRKTLSCTDCLGLFVPREAMTLVLAALRDGHDIELSMAPYRTMHRSDARTDERSHYLQCPECAGLMNRTELIAGAGVVVDMCLMHGVWFDRGELSVAAGYVKERRRSEGQDLAARAALESIAAALGRFFKR